MNKGAIWYSGDNLGIRENSCDNSLKNLLYGLQSRFIVNINTDIQQGVEIMLWDQRHLSLYNNSSTLEKLAFNLS